MASSRFTLASIAGHFFAKVASTSRTVTKYSGISDLALLSGGTESLPASLTPYAAAKERFSCLSMGEDGLASIRDDNQMLGLSSRSDEFAFVAPTRVGA